MSSKLTKRVKLPKEEENGNEQKGQDPKDETKVTPDKVSERDDVPEYFARSRDSFLYEDQEKTITRLKEQIQEYEKQILLAEKTIKEKDNDKIETIKKIKKILPASPGPNLILPRTPRAQHYQKTD
jgi:hypothetical protein